MANRYWVGGAGTWNTSSTTNWSTSSGGSSGASVPTSSDSVFFDSGSGTPGTITCTGALNCLDFTTSVSGWTITQTSATISVYGNFTLDSGTTWSLNNQLNFPGSTTQTVITNGVTITGSIVASGSGTFKLSSAITCSGSYTSSGTKSSDFGYTTATFSSVTIGATSATVSFGSVGLVLTGSGTCFSETVSRTSYSYYATSVISATSSSPKTMSFYPTNSYVGINQGGTGALTLTTSTGTGRIDLNSCTFKNSVQPATISVTGGLTIGSIGTLQLNGTAGNLVTLGSTNTTPVTLESLDVGVQTGTYCSVSYITGSNTSATGGTVLWRFLNSTNGGNNTNLTFGSKYYWVGGSGTWDNSSTTNWSLTSGGASGAGVPTQNDDVVFNSSSNTSSYIVSGSGSVSAFNITVSGPASGSVSVDTLNMSVYGNITLAATGVAGFGFYGGLYNSYPVTLTTNGVPLFGSQFGLYGSSTVTLGSALSTSYLYLNSGTLNTSGYNITSTVFDTQSSTPTLNLDASNITVSGYDSTSVYTFRISTGSTVNAGTSTINVTGANNGTYLLQFGGKTFYNVTLNNGNYNGVIYNITDTATNTFDTFTYNGSSTAPNLNTLTLSGNITATTLYLNAVNNNYNNRLFVKSDTIGTQRTITWSSTVGANFCDFRDINSTLNVSGNGGDCGGNSNITFPTAKTVYWNLAGTQNWSATGWATSSGGTPAAANFPLAQDTAYFDNTGSAGTVSIDKNWNIGTIDALNRSTSMTLSTGTTTPTIYGSWYTPTAITRTGTGTLTFSGRSSLMYISDSTSGTMTFTQPITLDAPGGFLQMSQPWTISNAFTLTRGTLYLINSGFGSYTLTCQSFSSSSTNTRTIAFGAGQINVTGGGAFDIIWDTSTYTNLTVTGTPTVNFTYSGSTGYRDIRGPNSLNGSGTTPLVNVNITAGSDAVYLDNGVQTNYLNVNFTGFTGGFQVSNAISVYGNFTLGSGMTVYTSTNALTFLGTSGTQTITTNGVTVNFPIVQNGSGGAVTLGDALTSSKSYTQTNGTFNSNSKNLTLSSFTKSTTNGTNFDPVSFTTSTWTITGSGTCFDAGTFNGTGFALGTSIYFTSASPKTAIFSYDNWPAVVQAGLGTLTINGQSGLGTTLWGLRNTVQPTTIIFSSGQTFTIGGTAQVDIKGTAGNLLTLQSSSSGTQFTLSKSSGAVYSQYLSIKDSNATGGADWRAGTTSTFVSNVSGWLLLDVPTTVRARINSSGVLFVPNFNQLDEVSKSVNSVGSNALYSNLFDETQSLNYNGIPVAQRKTADGKLLVSGYFDETTLQ